MTARASKPMRLTPKQRVLKKYPKATCLPVFYYAVMNGPHTTLSREPSPEAAWAEAAKRIK